MEKEKLVAVNVTMSPELKKKIKLASISRDMNASEFIRMCTCEFLEKLEAELTGA